jgi:hypothetical protein
MRYSIFISAPLLVCLAVAPARAQHLPGTEPLTQKADFAKVMVEGIDRWLDRETAASVKDRGQRTKTDFPSPEAYDRSLQPKRERLKKLLGLIDARAPKVEFEIVAPQGKSGPLAETQHFVAYAVRWPVLPNVTGEGLLLAPKGKAQANVVALPDAEQTPEQIAGLAPGLAVGNQFARVLAENGCRVLIPTLIDRKDTWSGNPAIGRMTNQSHREFVQRMAWEMGRSISGYELQRVFAGFDGLDAGAPSLPRGIYGFGEGARLAIYAAALDSRIRLTTVSGDYGPLDNLHEEPFDRGVWNVLRGFHAADLEEMIAPRGLIVEDAAFTPAPLPKARAGRSGAAPGTLRSPTVAEVKRERDRLATTNLTRMTILHPNSTPGLGGNVNAFLSTMFGQKLEADSKTKAPGFVGGDMEARQKRQFDELVDYTQKLLPDAVRKRQGHVWDKVDVKTLDGFRESQEPLREDFWSNIVGKMPEPTKNLNPRTRLILETPKWKGYEVVLDVYEEVISYGILLVPNDIKPGEKRPCVVCQHGLEGRPMDVVDPTKKTKYYNSFGAQLADRGYIVFAPQAPYIFENQFRQLTRKMHPLGLNLYAVIVRQHQQILAFLGNLPFVDATRIAYYGLSYGGKVAMRIPAVLLGYCAVICSGDFNEWIWKNITLDWGGSYMFTREYDMYEFNLGNTFNYAEMAALIAPRPFMVERGHDDGVGLDEYVAFEYAKVRRLYSRLGIPERTEIEFFPGGHEIRGVGTFAFLQKHLNWPPERRPAP